MIFKRTLFYTYFLRNCVLGDVQEVMFKLDEDSLARQRATCANNELELERNSMFILRGETAQQFWVRITELKSDMLMAGLVMNEKMEVDTFLNGLGKILRDTRIENGKLKLDYDQSPYVNFIQS